MVRRGRDRRSAWLAPTAPFAGSAKINDCLDAKLGQLLKACFVGLASAINVLVHLMEVLDSIRRFSQRRQYESERKNTRWHQSISIHHSTSILRIYERASNYFDAMIVRRVTRYQS